MVKQKKIRIDILSYNSKILRFLMDSLAMEFKHKLFVGPFYLPKKKKIFCVLRSPFVNKDSRDIFEIQTHKGFFICNFKDLINTLKYLRLLFKKFSFEFSNNIFIKVQEI